MKIKNKTSKELKGEIQALSRRMERFYASIRAMETQRSNLIDQYFKATRKEWKD